MIAELIERLEKAEGRFWSMVERGAPEACWNYTGWCYSAADRLPYGVFTLGKTGKVRAHRAAYMLTHGAIPAGLCVCHKCDNPKCCNPDHLWLGTHADNNRDRAAKGRTVRPPRNEATIAHKRGADHSQARIGPDEARAIFLSTGPHRELAARYGLSVANVSRIRLGKLWAQATKDLVRP